jgi:ribonuclease HII
MKKLLGIDDATRCPCIGSLMLAVVVVDSNNFWRKYSYLPIKDSKLLTRAQRDKIVNAVKDKVWFDIYPIRPQDMEEENLNLLEAKAIIDLLNRYPKFWKECKIHIDNFEHDKQKFIERLSSALPHMLRNIEDKLGYENWVVEHEADKNYKIVSLASIFAKWASDIEYDEIRNVWGDFGSGSPSDPKTIKFCIENQDCPHIRKSWKTIKRLNDPENKKRIVEALSNGDNISKLYKRMDHEAKANKPEQSPKDGN